MSTQATCQSSADGPLVIELDGARHSSSGTLVRFGVALAQDRVERVELVEVAGRPIGGQDPPSPGRFQSLVPSWVPSVEWPQPNTGYARA